MTCVEVLEHLDNLDGYRIVNMDKIKEEYPTLFEKSGQMNWKVFESEIRPKHFIYIRPEKGSITFNMQRGPIKEVGLNGCQVDQLISAAKEIISEFNKGTPCRENSIAITKLDEALLWLQNRTKERMSRGV